MMKKKVLFLMALLVSSTMAWAQTAPEGLSIDPDYSSNQEGYYYVNMPSNDSRSITFTNTDLVFKVYDDGGKNGKADGSGYLKLEAPVGYGFEIEGRIVGMDEDMFVIYNSSWDDWDKLLYYLNALDSGGVYNQPISVCRTTDNWMYIYYLSQSYVDGFELTVRIKPLHVFRGQGTSESPYEIWSSEAWDLLRTNVAAGQTYAETYFKQMLDFTVTQGVGTSEYAFSGNYDGNNHKLTCAISESGQAAAPFYRTIGTKIENLHVTGTISGGIHTAGLVAHNSGTSQSTIRNCRVSATITCTGNDVNNAHGGGIIGHAEDSKYLIDNCLFDGKLIAVQNDKGGKHLGAIVGWGGDADNRTITSTIEKGTYEGMEKNLIGFCWKDDDHQGPSDATENFYFGDLGQTYGASQLLSVANGTEGVELDFSDGYTWQDAYQGAMKKEKYSNRYLIDGNFYTKSGISASFRLNCPTKWQVTAVKANGTTITGNEGLYTLSNVMEPVTITVECSDVLWTDEGKYATEFSNVSGSTITITSAAELARLAHLVNSGTDTGSGNTYKLGQDIDMSAYYWTTIGNASYRFLGTLDGDGHKISGLHTPTTVPYYAALIRTNNGTVKNLTIANSSFYGSYYVAAIVCDNRNLVENCRVESDVIVTCTAESGDSYSGGVVARQQNQDSGHSYDESTGVTRGCYSAAQVSGNDRVGGLVGRLASGTVEYNVSEATVSKTAETTRIAKVIGEKEDAATAQFNFYISDTESTNTTDVRAYPVKLADDLKNLGYTLSYRTDQNFDNSQLYFKTDRYSSYTFAAQFKMGDEWYAPHTVTVDKTASYEGHTVHFSFDLIKEVTINNEVFQMATAENVKVNGETAKTYDESTTYLFDVTGAAVITGTPAITLYDDSDWNNHYEWNTNNEAVLYYNNGSTGNVTLSGHKFYKDGCWNTICLPFKLTISGSVLDGATVKTLASSAFNDETGVLTLNFTDDLTTIEAGMPYIIKWDNDTEHPTIDNPKFENVTISFNPETDPKLVGDEDNDPVTFGGGYFHSVYPKYAEGYKDILYMGANNTLYYPDGSVENFTIGAFRAVFALRDGLEAGAPADPAQSAITFVLNFGDGETTEIISNTNLTNLTNSDAWYDLNGHKLNGKPSRAGIYINNGKKIVVK